MFFGQKCENSYHSVLFSVAMEPQTTTELKLLYENIAKYLYTYQIINMYNFPFFTEMVLVIRMGKVVPHRVQFHRPPRCPQLVQWSMVHQYARVP